MRLGSPRISVAFTALVAAVSTVAGATLGTIAESFLTGKVIGSPLWMSAFMLFCLVIICLLIHHIIQRVEELHLKNRLSVRYIAADDPEDPQSAERLYREARHFIEEAKEDGTGEILAVNSFVELFQESDNNRAEDERQAYLQAIENKIGKVDYQRILQFDQAHLGNPGIPNFIADSYREHFRRIVRKREQASNRKVRLDRVSPKYPTSYVVVDNHGDNSYLIWQLNEHSPLPRPGEYAVKLRGIFLVIDPEQQLIRHFKAWFNQLANSADLRAITLEDLAGPETLPPGESS